MEGKNPYSYVSLSGEISESKPPNQRPQACGQHQNWEKKTNKRTNDFFHHRETSHGKLRPKPPLRSWIPRPRLEVEPPFASGGPGAFHPGLGYIECQEKMGKIFGEFPPECERTKIRLMNSGSIFFWGGEGGTKDLKVCLYFRVNSWTSWHKDSGDPENSQWRKVVQKIRFQKLGVLENWKDSTSIQIIILFLTCFVRAFPTKPRFKTPPRFFATKNGDVNPLPSLPTKKTTGPPDFNTPKTAKLVTKYWSSPVGTLKLYGPARQRPASTHMFYHGKIEVMVRKSCDNQLRYICIIYVKPISWNRSRISGTTSFQVGWPPLYDMMNFSVFDG